MSLTAEPDVLSDKDIIATGRERYRDDPTLSSADLVNHTTSWTVDGAVQPSWLPTILRELERISGLPDRWDGEAAHRPSSASVLLASSICRRLAPPSSEPQVMPRVDGSIRLEWEGSDGDLSLDCLVDDLVLVDWDLSSGTSGTEVVPARKLGEFLRTLHRLG